MPKQDSQVTNSELLTLCSMLLNSKTPNIRKIPNIPDTLETVSYHACGNQSAHDIKEHCSVNMDVW